jgi:hypothetical protein
VHIYVYIHVKLGRGREQTLSRKDNQPNYKVYDEPNAFTVGVIRLQREAEADEEPSTT